METITTYSSVDELGQLLAQISVLNDRATAIKDEIKDEASLSGQKQFDGSLFRATYTESNRSVVDWKAIAKVLNIPADLIAQHTSPTAVFSVKVTSR